MLNTHVNLCDLLDSADRRGRAEIFDDVEELRRYTLESGKIFPKEEAYAGGLLKFLLREITGTYQGPKKKGGSGKGRRRRR